MLTASLMLLSTSSSTTPPDPDLNRRRNGENRDSDFRLCLLVFAPVRLLCCIVISWLLENEPANAISDFHLVEIDQQTEGHVEQFHVAQECRLVNGNSLFDRLRL